MSAHCDFTPGPLGRFRWRYSNFYMVRRWRKRFCPMLLRCNGTVYRCSRRPERRAVERAVVVREVAGARCGGPFAPPIVGPIAPLTDVLVHTRDVERPLGLSANLLPEGLWAALDYCCGGRAYGLVPGKRTESLRFEATDVDWSAGEGALVSGPAEAILLAVTNRPIALRDLSGDGVEMLASRLA